MDFKFTSGIAHASNMTTFFHAMYAGANNRLLGSSINDFPFDDCLRV
jgi:hypothetical protein